MLNAINWKLKYGLIVAAIGIVLFFMTAGDAFAYMKAPINVTTAEQAKNLKVGDHITMDMVMVDGCIISQTTTTSKNGKVESTKESARYYSVPFFSKDGEYISYDYSLIIKVNSELFDTYERGWDAYDAFCEDYYVDYEAEIPSTVICQIEGLVTDIEKDGKQFIDESKAEGYILDYTYVNTVNKSSTFIGFWVGIGLFAVGALLIVLFIVGRGKDKARTAEFQASNPNYYQAPSNATFNNGSSNYTPYGGFDPSTDPRFNGQAMGNPTGNNQLNGQAPNQGIYQDPNQAQIPQNPGPSIENPTNPQQ